MMYVIKNLMEELVQKYYEKINDELFANAKNAKPM